jgi:hypothetical protein
LRVRGKEVTNGREALKDGALHISGMMTDLILPGESVFQLKTKAMPVI